MKKSRFTESQIMAILNQAGPGASVADICREHCISPALFYQWRSKYAGMDASMISRLKELEVEDTHLKRIYAGGRLKAEVTQDLFTKFNCLR